MGLVSSPSINTSAKELGVWRELTSTGAEG
jgi:hypothetical protein